MSSSTRERLLGAAIDSLLDAHGPALTTGRLAARAGVVQSAFYNHFASVDECRQSAMAAIRERVTATASTFFADLRGPGLTTAADVECMLFDVFDRAHQHPTIYRLIVSRRLATDVGELVDDVIATLRAGLADTILRNAPEESPMGPAEASRVAAYALAVLVAGLEQVLAGADARDTARAASRFIVSGVFNFHDLDAMAD